MKHIYSKSAFKKYRQSKGVSSTHYQRWAETFTEPSPGPSISRPNPPSDFTIRSDDSIIEIEDPEPCSSSSFIQEPLGSYLLSPFLPRVPVQGVSIEIWLLLSLMLSLHGLTIILYKLDDLPLMACFRQPYLGHMSLLWKISCLLGFTGAKDRLLLSCKPARTWCLLMTPCLAIGMVSHTP